MQVHRALVGIYLRHVMYNELIMRVWTTFNGELYACDETGLSATWISNSEKKDRESENNEERKMCNSETQHTLCSPLVGAQRDPPSQLARLRLLSPQLPLFNTRSCGETALIPR